MDKEIVISIKTVFVFLSIIGIAYLLLAIKPIILLLLVSTLVTVSMEHPIQYISNIKIGGKPFSRSSAIILSYSFVIASLITCLVLVLPPVFAQIRLFIPVFIEELSSLIWWIKDVFLLPMGIDTSAISVKDFLPAFDSLPQNLYQTSSKFVSLGASAVTVIFFSIYMSLEWPSMKRRLFSLFKGKMRKEAEESVAEIETSVGVWVKGQLFLMLVIGLSSWIGLLLIGVEYSLALALIAGLLEVVPLFGPMIALLIGAMVALSQDPLKAVLVIVLFALIQQLENNILVPKIMQKVSGFSPLIIMLGLLIGFKFLGIVGAISVVPLMMIALILIRRASRYSRD